MYLVPGLRNEQVLPLVHPQYGSLEAMQLLQRHNPTLIEFKHTQTRPHTPLVSRLCTSRFVHAGYAGKNVALVCERMQPWAPGLRTSILGRGWAWNISV